MRKSLSLILLVLAPALLMQAPATLADWVPGIAVDELPLAPQYKQVVVCVNLLALFSREFYHFVDRGETPSEEACKVLLQTVPSFCRRRADVFLNVTLQQARSLKLVCANRLQLHDRRTFFPIVPSPFV